MKDKKQLPPELVEKYEDILPTFETNSKTRKDIVNECAQIAIDYAEEEKKELINNYEPLSSLLHCLLNGFINIKLPKYRKEELSKAISKFEKQLTEKHK